MPVGALLAVVIDAVATEVAADVIGAIAADTIFATAAGALTTVGEITAGVVGGALGGAITGGITGQDPGVLALQGAITGGISGGISASGITSDISSALGGDVPGINEPGGAGGLPGGGFLGSAGPKVAGLAAKGLVGGAAGLVGGTLSGLAGGQSFNKALQQGEVSAESGLAGGVASGAADISGLTGFNKDLLQKGLGFGANQLVGALNQPSAQAPPQPRPQTGQGTAPQVAQAGPTAPQQPSPGDAALGQALRAVPDIGYTPSETVFGGPGTGGERKVWNLESLRTMES